ncbi:hypothetical protein HNR39_003946 [Glaciimonas immobilis]|uniref:Uncharacterized protein n=1 Tax=Glaciimonas immobilis TaxID=728004 RepID=A0A840RWX0_9BURK|nr:hypothetical protein HAV38_08230 [Glaciimonas immobilis]MBB5202083.1 hypothetical protein [Glaciimonas immobilis]
MSTYLTLIVMAYATVGSGKTFGALSLPGWAKTLRHLSVPSPQDVPLCSSRAVPLFALWLPIQAHLHSYFCEAT